MGDDLEDHAKECILYALGNRKPFQVFRNGLVNSQILSTSKPFYFFQMAVSNIRYGAGVTKEVGMASIRDVYSLLL